MAILLSGGDDCLLFAIILLSLSLPSQGAPRGGGSPQCALYEGFTDSRCLSNFNIDSSLTESKTAWVVEFYSSWCGHCHHFSPTWKKVASRIKGWSSVVRMGQIDCTHSDNRAICGLYHIQAFPTIKLFGSMTKNPHSEGIKTFLGRRSEESLLEAIIRLVESESLVKCLEPLETKLPSNDLINVLIFEEKKSLLGSEIIMDFLLENVKIRRVLPENTVLSSRYSILQFPSLVILPSIPNQQHLTFIPKREGDEAVGSVREFFEEKITEEVLNRKRVSEERNIPLDENERPVEASLAVNRVTITDILSTISYCLRYEVTLKKIISGEDFYTLHQFIYHLEKVLHSLAGESSDLDSIQADLKSLYTKLSAKYSTGFMSSTDWQILLRQKLHNKTLPLKPEWKACAGSRSEFRGFPCGLWSLLHTATVVSLDTRGEKGRVVRHEWQENLKREPKNSKDDDNKENTNNNNSNNNERGRDAVIGNDVISFDGSVASSREVLYSFSHFITNFFSCQSCREHFNARVKSDLQSFPLSYDGDAVMWAWAIHNDVNWRLRDDVSTDPAHPKSLFPSYETCPYCYKKHKQSNDLPTWDNIAPPVLEGIAKGRSPDVGTPPSPSEVIYEWNQTAVFIYLCYFYGHGKFDHTPHHVLVRAGWPRKYPTYASDHYGSRLHGATPLSSLTLLVYLLVAAVLLAYMLNFKLKRTRFKAQ